MNKEDFIPGVWYDFRGKDADAVAAKFTHLLDNTYFGFSELIRGNKHKFYNGNWYACDAKCPIDMKEIAHLLPYPVEIQSVENYQIY